MRRIAMLIATLAVVAHARAEGLYERLFEPRMMPVEEVIGMKVVTPDGTPLGTIRDLLFDRNTGIVQSIAVDGSGTTTFPVSALLSSDAPGTVVVEPPLDFSSGGPSALLAAPAKPLSSANGAGLVIDLRAGRVRSLR